MKKKILALGCMAALLAFSSDAFAALGTATATIGTAISITQDAGGTNSGNLAFGHIIPGTGGTVTIAPDGTPTFSGNVTLTTQLTKSAAQFAVTGDAGKTYSVTLPLDNIVTITSGGNTMHVDSFTKSLAGAGTLDANGAQTFKVGGTLTVGSGQPTGVYTGTFTVTAAYQ